MNWLLPAITDYFDFNTDAIDKYSRMISQHDGASDNIKNAVSKHCRGLSDDWIKKIGFTIAEDLYKTANYIIFWDERLGEYLEVSAGTFFSILKERGYILRYLIDNTGPETAEGYQRPLHFFGEWFISAGFIYICPQAIAMEFMKVDKVSEDQYFKYLPKYIKEARDIATKLVKKCLEGNKHYVYLEFDKNVSAEAIFQLMQHDFNNERIISLYRSEPPIKGSKCRVWFPS